MKTLRTPIRLAAIITAGLLTFSACHKKEKEVINDVTPPGDTEQTTAADNNLAENTVNDIESMGSEVSESGNLTTFRTDGSLSATGVNALAVAPCATVTGVGTQTITVDFGSGCMGTDGRLRSGKLIYSFLVPSGSTVLYYRNPGFTLHVASQNYVVDSNQVNIISKTITNTTPNTIPLTPNPGTNLTWSINASISIIKAHGGTISWACSRTKELVNTSAANCYHGQSQPIDWTHALVKLNGTSTGTNASGESFTATITDLLRDFDCHPLALRPHYHPFLAGTIAYTPGTRPVRLIDFGTGSCDNNATISINGQSYSFLLY